jgi:hypothetical protein
VFNATFNNISVITWRSVLLVGKPEYQEKATDLPQVTDKLYHKMLYRVKLQNYNFRSQEKRVRTIVYTLKFFRYNAAQICNELHNH